VDEIVRAFECNRFLKFDDIREEIMNQLRNLDTFTLENVTRVYYYMNDRIYEDHTNNCNYNDTEILQILNNHVQ